MNGFTSKRPVIAVDWGTSSFRAYALAADGEVVERRDAAAGILQVDPGGFPAVLKTQIGDWLSERSGALVMMSGMIGSRQGWMEVPYCACPCDLAALAGGLRRLDWPEAEVWIVPGLIDESIPGLPDVMRGEETQVFGALTALPGDTATVCLPGTHSKWVSLAQGRVESFATYMTGEVYDLLQAHSILGRLMTPAAVVPDAGFAAGVKQGASGQALLHLLFSVRSRVLNGEMSETEARPYLSGLLIGREITAAVSASRDQPQELVLLGAQALARLYEAATQQLGFAVRLISGDVVAKGLFQLSLSLQDGPLQGQGD